MNDHCIIIVWMTSQPWIIPWMIPFWILTFVWDKWSLRNLKSTPSQSPIKHGQTLMASVLRNKSQANFSIINSREICQPEIFPHDFPLRISSSTVINHWPLSIINAIVSSGQQITMNGYQQRIRLNGRSAILMNGSSIVSWLMLFVCAYVIDHQMIINSIIEHA